MKKNSLRNLVLALLVLTSLASYIFLNTVEVNVDHSASEINVDTEVEKQEEREMMLPDVKLIKRFIEKSRTILTYS